MLALSANLELHANATSAAWGTTTNTEASLNGDAALKTIFNQSQLQAASSYSTNEVFGADHVTGPYSWFGGSTLEQQVILPPNGTWVENTIISAPPILRMLSPALAYAQSEVFLSSIHWHDPQRFIDYYNNARRTTILAIPLGSSYSARSSRKPTSLASTSTSIRRQA